MKKKIVGIIALIACLTFTACSKKEEESVADSTLPIHTNNSQLANNSGTSEQDTSSAESSANDGTLTPTPIENGTTISYDWLPTNAKQLEAARNHNITSLGNFSVTIDESAEIIDDDIAIISSSFDGTLNVNYEYVKYRLCDEKGVDSTADALNLTYHGNVGEEKYAFVFDSIGHFYNMDENDGEPTKTDIYVETMKDGQPIDKKRLDAMSLAECGLVDVKAVALKCVLPDPNDIPDKQPVLAESPSTDIPNIEDIELGFTMVFKVGVSTAEGSETLLVKAGDNFEILSELLGEGFRVTGELYNKATDTTELKKLVIYNANGYTLVLVTSDDNDVMTEMVVLIRNGERSTGSFDEPDVPNDIPQVVD